MKKLVVAESWKHFRDYCRIHELNPNKYTYITRAEILFGIMRGTDVYVISGWHNNHQYERISKAVRERDLNLKSMKEV